MNSVQSVEKWGKMSRCISHTVVKRWAKRHDLQKKQLGSFSALNPGLCVLEKLRLYTSAVQYNWEALGGVSYWFIQAETEK